MSLNLAPNSGAFYRADPRLLSGLCYLKPDTIAGKSQGIAEGGAF